MICLNLRWYVPVIQCAPTFTPSADAMTSSLSPRSVLGTNIRYVLDSIGQVVEPGTPGVVLPEYAFTGPGFPNRSSVTPFLQAWPAIGDSATVCDSITSTNIDQMVVAAMSCAAQARQIDVVADLPLKQQCSAPQLCPPDGVWHWNAAVAWNSSGHVVAVYRKSHLFYEPAFNAPNTPDAVTFTTSKGLHASLMVCFDIMFPQPTLQYIADGVDIVLMPSWWVNQPPLLTASSVHAGWSSAVGLRLVVANAGSGWWSSGSSVIASFDEVGCGGTSAGSHSGGLSYEHNGCAAVAVNSGYRVDCVGLQVGRRPKLCSVPASVASPFRSAASIRLSTDSPLNMRIQNVVLQPNETARLGANNVSCSGFVRWSGQNSAFELRLFLALGEYNALFPAVFCVIVACNSAQSASHCITSGDPLSTSPLQWAEAQVSVSTSTSHWWQAQGTHTSGLPVLPSDMSVCRSNSPLDSASCRSSIGMASQSASVSWAAYPSTPLYTMGMFGMWPLSEQNSVQAYS